MSAQQPYLNWDNNPAKIKHYSSTQCKQCTTYMSTNGGIHIETSDQTYCDVKEETLLCFFVFLARQPQKCCDRKETALKFLQNTLRIKSFTKVPFSAGLLRFITIHWAILVPCSALWHSNAGYSHLKQLDFLFWEQTSKRWKWRTQIDSRVNEANLNYQ